MTVTTLPDLGSRAAEARAVLEVQSPAVLFVAICQIGDLHAGDHPLLDALEWALEIVDRRRPRPRDDEPGGRYHRQGVLVEYTALQKLRYPPTGNRELWVKYGPDGPPANTRNDL